jgi:hypothetical protein
VIELPRFAGLEKNRSSAEREFFVRTMAEAGFDPVAIAAVIEVESNRSWSPSIHGPAGTFSDPPGYPIGLIQFAPSTARSLGTTTDQLERMSFAEQLPYVVAYYRMFGGPDAFREPGDYYLAGWGTSPRTSGDAVLALEGSAKYRGNPALDLDKDGTIYAHELRDLVNRWIANGRSRGIWQIDVTQAVTIPVRVVNPQGAQIGTASVSDAVAPGVMALASVYGAPIMVAYPNGWRFVQFAGGVQIPAKSNLPYVSTADARLPSFGWQHGAAVLGIVAVVTGIFWATLKVKPERSKHAQAA